LGSWLKMHFREVLWCIVRQNTIYWKWWLTLFPFIWNPLFPEDDFGINKKFFQFRDCLTFTFLSGRNLKIKIGQVCTNAGADFDFTLLSFCDIYRLIIQKWAEHFLSAINLSLSDIYSFLTFIFPKGKSPKSWTQFIVSAWLTDFSILTRPICQGTLEKGKSVFHNTMTNDELFSVANVVPLVRKRILTWSKYSSYGPVSPYVSHQSTTSDCVTHHGKIRIKRLLPNNAVI